MASSGGNKLFDPWKAYDVTPHERKLIEDRAKTRAQLKLEWQKKVTSPYRGTGGYIFDPAIQRHQSMIVTQFEHFKATPKTATLGLALLVIPIGGLTYAVIKQRAAREKRYRAGEVKYKDREFKFV